MPAFSVFQFSGAMQVLKPNSYVLVGSTGASTLNFFSLPRFELAVQAKPSRSAINKNADDHLPPSSSSSSSSSSSLIILSLIITRLSSLFFLTSHLPVTSDFCAKQPQQPLEETTAEMQALHQRGNGNRNPCPHLGESPRRLL